MGRDDMVFLFLRLLYSLFLITSKLKFQTQYLNRRKLFLFVYVVFSPR